MTHCKVQDSKLERLIKDILNIDLYYKDLLIFRVRLYSEVERNMYIRLDTIGDSKRGGYLSYKRESRSNRWDSCVFLAKTSAIVIGFPLTEWRFYGPADFGEYLVVEHC